MVQFGLSLSNMVYSILVCFTLLWSNLVSFGLYSPDLVSFCLIWSLLVQFRLNLTELVHICKIWFIVVEFKVMLGNNGTCQQATPAENPSNFCAP